MGFPVSDRIPFRPLSVQTMHLQDLYIHPIKSLGGLRVSEARAEEKGLRLDRRWMLVDEDGRFLTQRAHPAMARLQVTPESDGLTVHRKDDPASRIRIPFEPPSHQRFPVVIWSDTVEAQAVDPALDRWFSEALGAACRLVVMPESTRRPVDPDYAVAGEAVSFADGMPFLLIGQGSLDDLNRRIEARGGEAVPMNRFRPNLVVSPAEPFAEDGWEKIRIGDCLFRAVKPCARCVVTTVDQDTGEKGKEPLATLATFRRSGDGVLFGQNLVLLEGGVVRVGDPVEPL